MIRRIIRQPINNKGITLTELIVASIMIGIVMIGVASFSISIKSFHRSTNKTVLIAMRAKAAMAELSEDASLAFGNSQDPGVYVYTNGVDEASACFRQDILNTADDDTDDRWVCWWHGNDFELHRCVNPTYVPPPGCTSQAECCNGASLNEAMIVLSDSTNEIATLATNADGTLEFINLTMAAKYDPTAPMHPVDNPEYFLTTQVSPIGHSR